MHFLPPPKVHLPSCCTTADARDTTRISSKANEFLIILWNICSSTRPAQLLFKTRSCQDDKWLQLLADCSHQYDFCCWDRLLRFVVMAWHGHVDHSNLFYAGKLVLNITILFFRLNGHRLWYVDLKDDLCLRFYRFYCYRHCTLDM